jgi:hypothetical protein
MRLVRPLRKLRQAAWPERLLVLEAVAWLAATRAAVRWLPFERVLRWLRLEPGESAHAPTPPAAEQVGWAVRGAAAHTPWQSACLVQALAAAGMLRWRGLPCTLYLGAARSQAQPAELLAHAWLRCGEQVLTGESESRNFPVLARFSHHPPPRG